MIGATGTTHQFTILILVLTAPTGVHRHPRRCVKSMVALRHRSIACRPLTTMLKPFGRFWTTGKTCLRCRRSAAPPRNATTRLCCTCCHFCMVNSVIKKVDTTVFSIWGVLRLAHKKVLWVCAYLSSLKKPLLVGAPSYKCGVQKVNSRVDYRLNEETGKCHDATIVDCGVPSLCTPICPISLPHFRLYEVVSFHMCVLPYRYR